ncbi:MurR/RpiR family transcriptional regulator [Aurantimonas sp. Leaf443]|uniref:MurR/RpiR family transcriptional regulator n=1 Tax=Aurantimonas sp. Leaf443 TaxID=1736378 RepID=UPI0006FE32FD|nr:MurR/RpiR family transcriptional regulator [Aurantimonas sp. Leaf443]KQT84102.1 RpiR family transcriptional regulator [Aurantimonas sp. Leaf443]
MPAPTPPPQTDEAPALPPPSDFEALRAEILSRNATLPKRLREVAAFALEHPDEIAFGTVASIAAQASVQPSTLVRFAQALGFEGFSSLQELFRDRLRERHPLYTERLKMLHGEESQPPSILLGFVGAAQRSLEGLATRVDLEAFERGVDILARAQTIYLVARRRSYPIGIYMAYAFGKLGLRCQVAGTAAGIDDDILALARPCDAAFVVSFSPYAPESVAQARALAKRGVPVVSLTDSPFSPLVEPSREWFELVEADHAGFRLLSATMTFAMALTVAVGERRQILGD